MLNNQVSHTLAWWYLQNIIILQCKLITSLTVSSLRAICLSN